MKLVNCSSASIAVENFLILTTILCSALDAETALFLCSKFVL